jgi:hypothetical protein
LYRRRVFEYDEMPVMLGHRDPKLSDGSATIREKARAECRICPSLGHDAGTIVWHPSFLCEVVQLLDSFRGVDAVGVKRRLYRFNTLLRRGSGVYDAIAVGHCRPSLKRRELCN